jgi:hypothetical protein
MRVAAAGTAAGCTGESAGIDRLTLLSMMHDSLSYCKSSGEYVSLSVIVSEHGQLDEGRENHDTDAVRGCRC